MCQFHLLLDDGEVLGRVNLVDIAEGSAELGFRIAEKAAGKGLATKAVAWIRALAVEEYGLNRLTAAAALDNAGSRAVLTKAGFAVTGEVVLDGKPGLTYELILL